jgi:hypothetical protein
MARSAALWRWQWGGTNWYSTSFAVKILQSGRCLVVKSLEFWFEILDREFLMDLIMGIDPF